MKLSLSFRSIVFWGILCSRFMYGVIPSYAQTRYLDDVFDDFDLTNNVRYSTAVPQPEKGGGFYEIITGLPLNAREDVTKDVDLTMDIYEPKEDTVSKRPVIVLCYGGGFFFGYKELPDMSQLAELFVLKGYVVVSIDYRLGVNMYSQTSVYRAVYRGIQDSRSAIRFLRADAAGENRYRIDPNEIYIGGHSAGAFIALHNGYLDKDSERPAATRATTYRFGDKTYDIPDLGCLDCVGDNKGFSGKADAVFSFAGAVGFSDHIEGSSDVPTLLFHSTNDHIVPYGKGRPFEKLHNLISGLDLPVVYGSAKVKEKAGEVNAPHLLYSYDSRGHFVHSFIYLLIYKDIVPRISTYLYDNRLIPKSLNIEGPRTIEMDRNAVATYTLEANGRQVDSWEVTGGEILSERDNSVTVQWRKEGEQRLSASTAGREGGFSIPVLVSETFDQEDINLYPNPGTKVVHLGFDKKTKGAVDVFLYDRYGRLLQKSGVLQAKKQIDIPVDHLKNGIYFIRIVTGGKVIHKTFKKE